MLDITLVAHHQAAIIVHPPEAAFHLPALAVAGAGADRAPSFEAPARDRWNRRLNTPQELRNASQPLQSRENEESALETEAPLELIDAQVPFMPFPLQHTKGDETASHMMQLCPL
jgi:hypothetical protein